jgi:hypothetical protein
MSTLAHVQQSPGGEGDGITRIGLVVAPAATHRLGGVR